MNPKKTALPVLKRRDVLTLTAGSLLPIMGCNAFAQNDYPNRFVRWVLPFPPGGGTELSARFIGKKFTEITGQPVVIDSRGGANGIIAVQAVLAAPADGYTLMFGSNATLATNAALLKTLPYDPVVDFQPLSLVIQSPIVFLTATGSPLKKLDDFVVAAKSQPDRHTIGSGSAGYHLMGALLARKAGFTYINVPYKSAAETVLAVISGQVEMGVVDITSAMPLIRGGKARALAIASERRNPGLPDVPTAAEAGVSGYTAAPWNGLVAPRGVPQPIVAKLSSIFERIMVMPDTRAFFGEQYVEILKGGAEPMRAFQREEIAKWVQIAADANIERQ
jgi:tripartite-type tricarboxylate transporter receptor subunit TctC